MDQQLLVSSRNLLFVTRHASKLEYRSNISQKLQVIIFLLFSFFFGNFLIANFAASDSYSFSDSFFRIFLPISKSYSLNSDLSQLQIFLTMALSILFLELELDTFQSLFRHQILTTEHSIHRLSPEEVFDNENRQRIVEIIMKSPGIHYNEILEQSALFPGQLQWHLRILEEYGILRQEKLERYNIYFTTLDAKKNNHEGLLLKKSRVTYAILKEIEENPGICISAIGKKLEMRRNTTKYHVDKLLEKNMVFFVKDGRKNHLYFQNNEN